MSAPTWKFWHPISFWFVLLIFFVAQLIACVLVVALREGLRLPVPLWIGNACGGAIAVVVVRLIAARRARA